MLKDGKEIQAFGSLWRNAGAPELPREQEQQLEDGTSLMDYEKGSHIHAPDAPCRGVLFIASGRLRVYLLSDEGREVTLYRVGAGDLCILSASCVLSAISFPVFIDAEEDTRVYQVGISSFRALTEENITLRAFAYEQALRRYADALWAMQQILFRGVDRRLAAYLLEEKDKQGSTTLSLRQEKIAADIGSSREVVSRMLRYFHDEGITENGRGKVTILDEGKLKERAGL